MLNLGLATYISAVLSKITETFTNNAAFLKLMPVKQSTRITIKRMCHCKFKVNISDILHKQVFSGLFFFFVFLLHKNGETSIQTLH